MKAMRKISAILIVCTMMTVGITMTVDNTVSAGDFIETVGNAGLWGTFTPEDVAWNDAGTMAVVVGSDSVNGPNAYAFWPSNETWYPLDGYTSGQTLYGVDCYSERYVPTPKVLLVDADWDEDGLAGPYYSALDACNADVTYWDIWNFYAISEDKPTFADMEPYDVVIWVADRNMDGWNGPGDAFSAADEIQIEQYLDDGGSFMLANIYYTDYTDGGSAAYSSGDFAYDYLGMNHITDTWSMYDDYINETVDDEVYDGFGISWLDWWTYGWSGSPDANDYIWPSNGEICFFGTDSGMSFYYPMGIRYDQGSFRSVFFGFPYEVLSSSIHREKVMKNTLEFFMPGSQTTVTSPAEVLIVDADYYDDGLWQAYNWSLSNNSADVTVWDVYGNHGPAKGKPSYSNMAGYDLVVWVPTRDMYGDAGFGDAFSSTDETAVSQYLAAGGNFFLSNIYWTSYTSGAGSYNPGDFAYDILGISSIMNMWSNYEDHVLGMGGDVVFDSFGDAYQNWNRFGWGGMPGASDTINPMFATSCMYIYDAVFMSDTGGVRYDQGICKSMFMGFPFETLQYPYTDEFWNRTMEWFVPGSTSYTEPTGLTQYTDTYWICGDAVPVTDTTYTVEPSSGLSLQGKGMMGTSLSAIACDEEGAPLIVGQYLSNMYYYDASIPTWYTVGGANLFDCSFEGLDYNPNDNRFYLTGYNGNWAWPVVYYTDPAPLNNGTSNAYYYQSPSLTSDCSMQSIAWNEHYDYGLAVGDEGYILKVWPFEAYGNGVMKYEDISVNGQDYYYDVSWDTDGWNEAGIVGSDAFGSDGLYYRYYHSNPIPLLAHDSNDGAYYRTCAMKPPSSPKWLFIPSPSGGIKAKIQADDQSSTVTVCSLFPNIYWAGFNDTLMNPKNNLMVFPDSWFYITFEANYSGGWNQVMADIHLWYDDGWTGTNSQYPTELPNNRNWAINLTYDPNAGSYVVNYPSAPVLEATIGAVSDIVTVPHVDPTQSRHRVELPIHLGAQMFAADGNGFAPPGQGYHSDPNVALNNPFSWDFNVTLYDTGNVAKKNSTYGEFGVNQAISISIAGSPSGEGPPGANDVALGSNVVTYSANSFYWVNVSIPDLARQGGGPSIPASNLQVHNTNNLATAGTSDIDTSQYFLGPGAELCVWGVAAGGALPNTGNGTTTFGPWGSNYNYYGNPAGTTTVDWYIDVPAPLQQGIYKATITYSIETQG
ncbi:MAG: hypothetical protein KAS67_01240 [Thermoplasmata archaeon]|nr:hypothetical protein [Thermoplasmata archaeon]